MASALCCRRGRNFACFQCKLLKLPIHRSDIGRVEILRIFHACHIFPKYLDIFKLFKLKEQSDQGLQYLPFHQAVKLTSYSIMVIIGKKFDKSSEVVWTEN